MSAMKYRLLVPVVAVALVAAVGWALVDERPVSATASESDTYGPIPSDAWDAENQVVDYSKVPTYIPVVGRDGEWAGYVLSSEIAGPNPPPDGPIVVLSLDETGEIVGHFWPEIGFVPLGSSPFDFEPVVPSTFAP